ncbi:glycosyltransferase family 4 protein [Clostridium sp. Ade.TY]|uniref:glycosyltransferase family 4 protein n=1 Tax=Clostridium sp. Ade.TY TaxID=1391647 RepID=UPI000411FFF1|nr:glycosyltransferase family 4 protein [Clostridium sp. Ade.TY]
MRVLYITNIPSPYRVEFFNELSNYCDLTVIFERDNAKDREDSWLLKKTLNFKSIFLKGKELGTDASFSFDIIKYLKKFKNDVIVIGVYSTPTQMLAIKYLKIKNIPFILNADGGMRKNDSTLKYKIKKHFISSASLWISTGKTTNDYLIYYGAKKDKIFTYPFTSLENQDILEKIIPQKVKLNLKNKLNIKEKKVVLAIGQFIYRKGFDILIKSCAKISNEYGVYIIGGNPPKEYIELRDKLNLSNVKFIGFKSKNELKEYYMASDVFVLPTREDIWGLVINEAMAYGLPIITTDKCVAGIELIKDNENGFIVPVDNEIVLAEKIENILCNDVLNKDIQKKNLDKIKYYTIERMAKVHYEIFSEFIGEKNGRD